MSLLSHLIEGDALSAWAHPEPGTRGDPDGAGERATTLRRDGGGWRLDGRKTQVHAAPWATHFVVSATSETDERLLVLIDAGTEGIARRDLRALDGGWSSELAFDGVSVASDARLFGGAEASGELARALDEATLAVCAESLGVMQRLLSDSLAHARERRQFGVPIATFQVLQHRIADMHMAREQAEALVWAVAEREAWSSAPHRALAVSSAKVTVNRACRVVGQGAVQIHGAMGVTEELAAARFFRRATQIERQFGSTHVHLQRIERLQRQDDLPGVTL